VRRATPAIVLSAAGLTWLLHAQGIIDRPSTPTAAPAGPAVGSTTTTTTPGDFGGPGGGFGGGPDDGDGFGGQATTTTAPSNASGTTTNGPAEQTEWGTVQVAIVVNDRKLVDVKVLQYPDERQRSVEINNQALPTLHQEALQAGNARIDSVSGATVTSDGYLGSLQAALDSAGIGG
jgi:uncharacterized protein with FMN-binding domain